MKEVYCPIRARWYKSLPEEVIRINLINRMVKQLGFPIQTIAVEVELKNMPHLSMIPNIPQRRADIICFTKGIQAPSALYPLLMIECKAVPLSSQVLLQIAGYNHFVKASFVCLANGNEVRTGWLTKEGKYEFISFLPTFLELKKFAVL